LKYLLKGLHDRKQSVLNIFRVWDKFIFPHTSSSLSGRPTQADANNISTRDVLALLNADVTEIEASEPSMA
jgi:hypothetical protein